MSGFSKPSKELTSYEKSLLDACSSLPVSIEDYRFASVDAQQGDNETLVFKIVFKRITI